MLRRTGFAGEGDNNGYRSQTASFGFRFYGARRYYRGHLVDSAFRCPDAGVGANLRRCADRARTIRDLASASPVWRSVGTRSRATGLASVPIWALGLYRRVGMVLGIRRRRG